MQNSYQNHKHKGLLKFRLRIVKSKCDIYPETRHCLQNMDIYPSNTLNDNDDIGYKSILIAIEMVLSYVRVS